MALIGKCWQLPIEKGNSRSKKSIWRNLIGVDGFLLRTLLLHVIAIECEILRASSHSSVIFVASSMTTRSMVN